MNRIGRLCFGFEPVPAVPFMNRRMASVASEGVAGDGSDLALNRPHGRKGGTAWPGKARTRHGKARHCGARLGSARTRLGKARHCGARLGSAGTW